MVFGMVLAGGIGSRMGSDKPKQYIEINGKPVIVYTLEKFCRYDGFEKVIVLCPSEWADYTKDIFEKHLAKYTEKIQVICGGDSRNETIMNGISYIDEEYSLSDDTIIVTHDAARPFINQRILDENISAAKNFGAATTAIAATDTILNCPTRKFVSDITDRSMMYQCQTPQTFYAKKLRSMYQALNEEEKEVLTDASGILIKNGVKVALVDGERYNMKVTYPNDLVVAKAYLDAGIVE